MSSAVFQRKMTQELSSLWCHRRQRSRCRCRCRCRCCRRRRRRRRRCRCDFFKP